MPEIGFEPDLAQTDEMGRYDGDQGESERSVQIGGGRLHAGYDAQHVHEPDVDEEGGEKGYVLPAALPDDIEEEPGQSLDGHFEQRLDRAFGYALERSYRDGYENEDNYEDEQGVQQEIRLPDGLGDPIGQRAQQVE